MVTQLKTFNQIEKARSRGPLHFTLIDPDRQTPDQAAELAAKAESYGSDAIMVGGSQAANIMFIDETVEKIKKKCRLPVILFPSSHSALTPKADALFFMSLLNSRSPRFIIEEQMAGAVIVAQNRIEPLGMAYLIVESGAMTSAAWVGDVKPIPRDKPAFAVGYALAAKFFGMKFIYLEGGSGAKEPVPDDMIAAVKNAVNGDCYVIVGGGIRDAKVAKAKVAAGADIIVTGTIAEQSSDKLKEIIKAIKG
jgi:phosphoglycerol geranylgeranyltransferase